MAAIIEPRRHQTLVAPRPALRLVTTEGRTVAAPVDLGLQPVHLVAALVALVLVVALTLAISTGALAGLSPAPAGAGATGGGSSAAAAASADAQVVTVLAGDSLWTIARRIQPTGDVRPLVDRLMEVNGGGPLQPGDRIVVPA